MLSPIQSNTCDRCNLQYNEREVQCPHCIGLSNLDALQLKKAFKKKSLKLNADIGSTFKFLALLAIVICVVLIF